MAPRTKRERLSDDFISDDETPKAKKAKSTGSKSKSKSNATLPGGGVSEGPDEGYWELSSGRRVTVSKYKGKTMVGIREYYEKDGVCLPGRKGISMPSEQLDTFIKLLPHLEAVLKDQGVALARPDYAGKNTSHNEPSEDEDDADNEENDGEEGKDEKEEDDEEEEGDGKKSKKKNFEETSDED